MSFHIQYILATLVIATMGAGILPHKAAPLVDEIHYIGGADGKSYFTEITTLRTWNESGILCNSQGLQLASIVTATQATLLRTSATTYFSGTFWTGARDAQTLQQMVWNSTKTSPPSSVTFGTTAPIATCGALYKATASTIAMNLSPCATKYFTLCSTKD